MLRLFGVVTTCWQRVCASTRSYALEPLDPAEQNYDLELEIIHTHGHMIAFTQEVIHCHHAKSPTVCWTVGYVGELLAMLEYPPQTPCNHAGPTNTKHEIHFFPSPNSTVCSHWLHFQASCILIFIAKSVCTKDGQRLWLGHGISTVEDTQSLRLYRSYIFITWILNFHLWIW